MQKSIYFHTADYNQLQAIAAYHRCSISAATVIAVNKEFDRIANIPAEPILTLATLREEAAKESEKPQ